MEHGKNTSIRRPVRLTKSLASCSDSIGYVACGEVQYGSCFLVTPTLVISNYHVYRDIQNRRMETGNSSLPITVTFINYPDHKQTENIVIAKFEVDEEHDPEVENLCMDYKFFRLKQKEGLSNIVPLGPRVRNWQLSGGKVVIIGYPSGEEMTDEICFVVGYRAMLDTIRDRYRKFTGKNMTDGELLHEMEDYLSYLSYDSTLFHGTSGSPVFEMSGKIVAMHTKGYVATIKDPNQPENVFKQGQKSVNLKKESLMEFGNQFFTICNDIRRRKGEKILKQIFPNYNLKPGQQIDALIEEASNPSSTERLPNDDLVRLEKCIKEYSASYVYTHRASSKDPFSEKARESMTRNVKTLAYNNLLDHNIKKNERNTGKFVNDDQLIFNLARDELKKNTSTSKPAKLQRLIPDPFLESIGRISWGTQSRTPVITCYHVCQSFMEEKKSVSQFHPAH